MTGAFHTPSDFDQNTTCKLMKDFYHNLNGLHESHLEQALTLESLDDGMDGTECHHDKSMLSLFCILHRLLPSTFEPLI